MIHAKRDSLLALIVTLAALAAFAWGLQRLSTHGQNDTPGGIAIGVGGLIAFLGLLVTLNFLWALARTRRLQRSEGVFARWTVPAEVVTAYVAQEGKRRWIDRSRWRPRPGQAAEIRFSDDAVLAGGRLHGLKARGLQIFSMVRLVPGTPDVIEFLIQEITASSAHNHSAGQFVLRLPVPPEAQDDADQVIARFRQVRTDTTSALRFWKLRRKIGVGVLVLSALSGAAGFALAARSGWRGDGTEITVALALMIVGVMFGLAGLFLTALAAAALRRNRQGIRPAI